ncbi:MAG: DUF4160 domain-containing protein [Gemmatimonadota bacterium]
MIRMFFESEEPHHRPHFHAYFQEHNTTIGIDPLEPLAGSIPRKQERMILAWAEIHQRELRDCWQRLQSGQPPGNIEPLR